MELILVRDRLYTPDCTLGSLYVPGYIGTYQTIERAWIPSTECRGGSPTISCVPAGTYKLIRHNSVKHPMTWALVNEELDVCHVPTPGKRDDVLIHPANYADELEGCIAPGTTRMFSQNRWMVLSSRAAFEGIKLKVPYTDEHILTITQS